MPPGIFFSISYYYHFEILGFDIKNIWVKLQMDMFDKTLFFKHFLKGFIFKNIIVKEKNTIKTIGVNFFTFF